MSDYRPTFKRSATSRPLRQRLTPLAWALIGVVALVLVLGMVGGALSWASRPPDEVWNPTPTATLPPTETPALPSLTPTEWWEGMVTPTAQVTAASPAWWMGQMTQDEEGRWWPPDEVVEMVRDDFDAYVEARNEFVLGGEPPDLDAYERMLGQYLSGSELAFYQGQHIEDVRAGRDVLDASEWEACLVQVQDFNEDGLECSLGRTCRNGTRYQYNVVTGELTSEWVGQMGLVIFRMRYDGADGRWKGHDFLEFVPPPGG
jgi:hypothetical protein